MIGTISVITRRYTSTLWYGKIEDDEKFRGNNERLRRFERMGGMLYNMDHDHSG